MLPSRICFSNIAWSHNELITLANMLQAHGVGGIEVAPSKIWPDWVGADVNAAKKLKLSLQALGFNIPALQAILFQKSQLSVFDLSTHQAFYTHMQFVASLAQAMGAKILVFGAPKNRFIPDGMLADTAQIMAANFFKQLATICTDYNVILGLEPNATEYGCNFITTAAQAFDFVRLVDHTHFKVHLDSSSLYLANEDLAGLLNTATMPLICHYHISEPFLADFVDCRAPHLSNIKALLAHGYEGIFSVEMRQPESLSLQAAGPWVILEQLKQL